MLRPPGFVVLDRGSARSDITEDAGVVSRFDPKAVDPRVDPTADLARCFLHLADLPNFVFDRLSRYEAALWRQVGQVLLALDGLDRRKPQERRRSLDTASRQDVASYEHDDRPNFKHCT
jgi:hypothetical protein